MNDQLAAVERVDTCGAARRLRRIGELSPREREVLDHAALGEPDQEIAGRMHVSHRTVRHYFTVLFQKLGVRNRVDVALTGVLAHVANCEECLSVVNAFHYSQAAARVKPRPASTAV